MARSASPARSSAARRARPPTPKRGGPAKRAATKTAKKGVESVAKAVSPKRVADKTLKLAARKAARGGARVIRAAAQRTTEIGKSTLETGIGRPPPIQLSLDVAAPIEVAWEQWLSYGCLPEGVHRIEGVQRDGDVLIGHRAGPSGTEWEAEIRDEREHESFAWRSTEGSDVAGLVTFHRLSDRLTRVELDLDVLPTNPAEALTLALHVAHRRAENDLRRFKAHVEFINPDVYEPKSSSNGSKRRRSSAGKGKRPARDKRGDE